MQAIGSTLGPLALLVLLSQVRCGLMVFDDNQLPDLVRGPPLGSSFRAGFLRLCLNVAADSPNQNVIVAPLSIIGLLALLMGGAQGETRREIQSLFGQSYVTQRNGEIHKTLAELFTSLENVGEIKEQMEYGSAIFYQKNFPISDQFVQFALTVYRTQVLGLNFREFPNESLDSINKWVSNKTHGHIKSLLDGALEPSTSLVLANAFFFKGTWAYPFIEKLTHEGKFYPNEHEVLKVPLMAGVVEVNYHEKKGQYSVLGLPYSSGEITMHLVLPEPGVQLTSLIQSMTPELIESIVTHRQKQLVIAVVPKFRLESTVLLKEALTKMGLTTLFDKRRIDLRGIGQGLFVSDFVHKVSLEVTEKGTVGSAASGVIILRDGSTPTFKADRPFLFLIHHAPSNTVLFCGTVYRPVF